MDRIFDELVTLSDHPRRCSLAAEDAHRPYEIRRLRIGFYLALFTIDEANKTVFVIGFRHGHHRQISSKLPANSPEG
ncbi:type II toxin-antitoxin system RelE/ParE family toxin [Aeoliella straminimaris]|uniref:type II toxin-antitoxin system RelE family toxin n=1 Tax=Aeoliella straminimaris TaxID=2954799 RepID=UPI00313431CD